MLQQYKTFIWAPEIRITEQQSLYVALYLYRGDEQPMLYDTYSGKRVSAGKPLFRGGPIGIDSPK